MTSFYEYKQKKELYNERTSLFTVIMMMSKDGKYVITLNTNESRRIEYFKVIFESLFKLNTGKSKEYSGQII